MMNNSMTRKAYGEWAAEVSGHRDLALESRIDLLNPLSSDLGSMRQSLIFQGLETIARNRNHQAKDLRFFEIGRTYHHRDAADGPVSGSDGTVWYRETEQLSLFLSGHHAPENWNEPVREADLFTLKAEVVALLEGLGMASLLEERNGAEGLYGEGVSWWWEGQCVGRLGAVHPKLLQAMDLEVAVYASEWFLEPLFQALHQPRIQARELPRFPTVRRDLSLILEKGTPFADIRRVAASAEPRLLTRVGLFDVYTGDKLPEGKVSYAISLTLQDANKTLTDKQIDRSVQAIRTALETQLGAALR
jgi:phenylalanyl-tRNA synthetase beta chain